MQRTYVGAILHRNIDARCNEQRKPYTIACAVLPQRHTQKPLLAKKNDLCSIRS
jgi:hypothetical protein